MSSMYNDWTWAKGFVDPSKAWKVDDIKNLPYVRQSFNDQEQVTEWQQQGFIPRTGMMYDMREQHQPMATRFLTNWAEDRGLEHVGISYYCMEPGDNLPYHSDTYQRYIQIFDLEARKKNIIRYVFFLEDRKPGHILEVDGKIIDWIAGNYIAWKHDVPHMAANFGTENRYTIQVTGVLR